MLVTAAMVSGLSMSIPQAGAAAGPARGLIFGCRLVSIDRGDEITLRFRLRTDEPAGAWRVRMFHEGERIVSKVRRTRPTGDLKVRRVVPDLPGRDDVIGRARHVATGAVCEVASRV